LAGARERSEQGSAPDGSLVLDRQRSVTPTEKRCPNSQTGIRLVTDRGWFPAACKRRNCAYCGPKRAREDARVLVLDAREQSPTHCITLTTVDPETTPKAYRHASAVLWKRLRRLYGRVEYYGHIEWTTGTAARSGGHRRMHGHYLVKFLDHDQVDVLDLERIVRQTWETVTGAYRVEVAQLASPGEAIGYLSLHHRKPEQAAPVGWRGMVGRPSLGYFHRPVAELREQARLQLRIEAIAWARGLTAPPGSLTWRFLEIELQLTPKPKPMLVREPLPGHALPEPLLEATDRMRNPETEESRAAVIADKKRLRPGGAPPRGGVAGPLHPKKGKHLERAM